MKLFIIILIILILTIYIYYPSLKSITKIAKRAIKEQFYDCPYGCRCRRCMKNKGNCPLIDVDVEDV